MEKLIVVPVSFAFGTAALSVLLRSRRILGFTMSSLPLFCIFTLLSFPLSFVSILSVALLPSGAMIAPCLSVLAVRYLPLLGLNWFVAIGIATYWGRLEIKRNDGKRFTNAILFSGTMLVATDCYLSLLGLTYADTRRCQERFRSPDDQTEVTLFAAPGDARFTVLRTRGADGFTTPLLGTFGVPDGEPLEGVYEWSRESQVVAIWGLHRPFFGYDFVRKRTLSVSLEGPWLPSPARLGAPRPAQLVELFDTTDKAAEDLLYTAALRGDASVAAMILARNPGTVSSETACGALVLASRKGIVSFVSLLLDSGLSANCYDSVSGTRPLHSAASSGQLSVCTLLVSTGADIALTDRGGYTALMLATWHKESDVISFLQKVGGADR